ncbi:MAG: 5' nucleotidase, NT5C type [Bacteroidales bacterium]
MKRIYIDMDGTVAQWNPTASFEELHEKGYFENLKPINTMVRSLQELSQREDVELFILTSYLPESKYAKEEKKAWLDKNMPFIREENKIYVKYGNDKSTYVRGGVSENDYLIDDYTKNLEEWDRSGGSAIKVLNGINHTHGTWKGQKINAYEKGLTEKIVIELNKPTKSYYIKEYEKAKEFVEKKQAELYELMSRDSYQGIERLTERVKEQLDIGLHNKQVAKDKLVILYDLHTEDRFQLFLKDKYIPSTIEATHDHYLSNEEQIDLHERDYDR